MISRRPERAAVAAALLAAAGVTGPVHAQALSCIAPTRVPEPRLAGPTSREPVRRLPIGGHTLVLSWSPQYCREEGANAAFQCDGAARFGFVLHGLWPDGKGRQWPQYCQPVKALPPRVIHDNLCMTPSADLLQHEWAKHGSCGWSNPATYFAAAGRLYRGLRFPEMDRLMRRRDLTVGQFAQAFADANRDVPGLGVESIRVRVTREGWLDELWLCLDRDLGYRRCAAGQGGGSGAGKALRIWRRGSGPF